MSIGAYKAATRARRPARRPPVAGTMWAEAAPLEVAPAEAEEVLLPVELALEPEALEDAADSELEAEEATEEAELKADEAAPEAEDATLDAEDATEEAPEAALPVAPAMRAATVASYEAN